MLLGNGTGQFVSRPFNSGEADPASIAVADADGDRLLDVIVGHGSGVVSLLKGDGNGSLRRTSRTQVGPNPISLQIADIKGDHEPALVVGAEPGKIYVVPIIGGQFSPPAAIDVSMSSPGFAPSTAADFDRGGQIEVVATHPQGIAILDPRMPSVGSRRRRCGIRTEGVVCTYDEKNVDANREQRRAGIGQATSQGGESRS